MASNLPPRYALSYWERETFFRNIDAVIIGSGIVGLNAAIRLRELRPQLRVLVLERGPLPIGASTRNAGFACFGSLSELLDDAAARPFGEVLDLVAKRYRGLMRLRERLGDRTIDYRPFGGFELFRDNERDRFEDCLEAMDSYNQAIAGITGRPDTYRRADSEISRFGFAGIRHLIHNQSEGQLHTGKMMEALLNKALSLGVHILNGIGIDQLETHSRGLDLLTTQGWTIRAASAIIATNGFAPRLLPDLDLRPARNQVLITKPVPGLRFRASFHYDRGYFYFRNIDGRILLGGGRNLDPQGETTDEFDTTPHIQQALLQLLKEVILPRQEVEVDTWWSGIMGVGPEKQPIVKKYEGPLVIAVRMGGMGVAIGSLIGEEAAEMLISSS